MIDIELVLKTGVFLNSSESLFPVSCFLQPGVVTHFIRTLLMLWFFQLEINSLTADWLWLLYFNFTEYLREAFI